MGLCTAWVCNRRLVHRRDERDVDKEEEEWKGQGVRETKRKERYNLLILKIRR